MQPPVATLHLPEMAHKACAPASAPGPSRPAVLTQACRRRSQTSSVTTFQQGVARGSQAPGAQWGWGLGHHVPLLGAKGHCPLVKWGKKGIW